MNTSLKRYLKGTGFECVTLHKLRHTNTTLLLNSGRDLKIILEHLGHSDFIITASVYTGVLDNSKIETANIIEEILTGKTEEKTPNKHQIQNIG